MNQLSKPHYPFLNARCLQSLLLVFISIITVPAFVSGQQSVKALETDEQQVASRNTCS